MRSQVLNRLSIAFPFLFSCLTVSAIYAQTSAQVKGAAGMGLGVAPSRVEMDGLRPGETRTVPIYVSASGSGEGRLRFRAALADWDLTPEGEMRFYAPYTLEHSGSDWIEFSPSNGEIRPGEQSVVRLTVRVPLGAEPGERRAILLLSTEPLPTAGNGPTFNVLFRVGVVVYLRVGELGSQPEIVSYSTSVQGDKKTLIVELQNSGRRTTRPQFFLFLNEERDAYMIVEKLPLLAGRRSRYQFELPFDTARVRCLIAFPDTERKLSFELRPNFSPFVESGRKR